jgi:polyhydroxyalkanoate synthesis regulator phasin
MKTKSIVELAAISSTLYTLSKDKELREKLAQWAEKGKDKVNDFVKDKMVDEDGKELDFMEKIAVKMEESAKEMEDKISETVSSLYSKMNITHTDELAKIKERYDDMKKELSLTKSRLTKLEKKEQ